MSLMGVRHRSGGEGSSNRSRDRKGALLALPINLTLPYGRGSDWSTPYARIFSIGRHLRKALTYVSRTRSRSRGGLRWSRIVKLACCGSEVRPLRARSGRLRTRSEEHTSELQSLRHLVCRLLL